MILKPTDIYPDNITFDATTPIKIAWKNQGDIMYAYEVVVENNSTGSLVYTSNKTFSFNTNHVIPENFLINGNVYRFKIKVYNKVDDFVTSDYRIFKCSSKPTISIITDGTIRNQTATISASYSQAENIPIKCYKFLLYDEYKNLIEQSEYIYSNDLSYSFNAILKDDTKYYIQCSAVTQTDLIGQSEMTLIKADYIPPAVHFHLKADIPVDKPFVRLSWTTVRIIGKTKKPPSYIDNKELDLTNNTLFFDEGFTLERDFTIKFWIRNVKPDVVLSKLIGINGDLIIMFYDNRFHAFKNISRYTTHVSTSPLTVTGNTNYVLVLQQKGNLLNIDCEVS